MEFTVANTIFHQLGGAHFAAMTGASFILRDDGLNIRIPRAKNGCNVIRITLTPADLYDVSFEKVTTRCYKRLAEHTGVYADDLQSLFTDETGLECHL